MVTLTIQPSAKDTWVQGDSPTTNFGSETYFYLEGSTYQIAHSLLEFSLASLPAGAVITSATLMSYYYTWGVTDPVGRTLWAYRLTRTDWVELEATYNRYKALTDWTTPAGDYTTTDGASVAVPASYGWMSWNVLAQVQYAQTNAIAVEFLIRDGVENSATRYLPVFYSREYTTDTTLCPKLVIEYTTLIQKSLSGTLNLTGSLISRLASKILAGTLNTSGIVNRKISVAKSGTLNLSGAVSKVYRQFKSLAGSLSFAGILATLRKIIGAGNVSVDSYLGIDTFHLSKFTAEFTGMVSKIKVYSEGNCNVKVAMYSDVGGEPSSLLSAVNTSTPVVAGWNTITIPSVSVNVGTAYWLAFNSG